jgi:hypothetical protein
MSYGGLLGNIDIIQNGIALGNLFCGASTLGAFVITMCIIEEQNILDVIVHTNIIESTGRTLLLFIYITRAITINTIDQISPRGCVQVEKRIMSEKEKKGRILPNQDAVKASFLLRRRKTVAELLLLIALTSLFMYNSLT